MIFRGLIGEALPQGVYRVQHATLGEFSLFITALGVGRKGGFNYEAVINRMVAHGGAWCFEPQRLNGLQAA